MVGRERRRDVGRRLAIAAVLCLNAALAHAADAVSESNATVSNPVQLQSLDGLSVTRERPLFVPSRRPPPKPVAPVVSHLEPPPPPAPPPPPSLVLLGIVSENGEGSAAIRSADKGSKVLRVRTGDDVGGWKIERIEPRRLVLTLGERSVDFTLFSQAGKTKTAEAPTIPPWRRAQAH